MQHFHDHVMLYLDFLQVSFKPFINFLKTDDVAKYHLVAIIVLIFILMILPKKPRKRSKSATDFTQKDFETIAGEDVIATQLDLAKAYIEMDKSPLAKKMLKTVAKKGNLAQRNEAKLLIKAL